MDIKIYLGKDDKVKKKKLVLEFQLLSLMLSFDEHIKKIKTPRILHINLYNSYNGDKIEGSASDPMVYHPLDIPSLSKLPIDIRFKKTLEIIKESYRLTCDYLIIKNKLLNFEIFQKVYRRLIKIDYDDFIPINSIFVPNKNQQLNIEISLEKKEVSASFFEGNNLKFRLNLTRYLHHPIDYFFFFKPFSFHSLKGNILSLKSKKILLCFNLINHNWFFKKRGKTPIPLEEKEELIFTFLDFEQDKQGYLNKCKELNDNEFLAYINDEIMELMI